jgi:hypothetical protein
VVKPSNASGKSGKKLLYTLYLPTVIHKSKIKKGTAAIPNPI